MDHPTQDEHPTPPEDTSVIRFEIAYNGTKYHGWQIQTVPITIQSEIQRVLSKILQSPIKVNGASRTDAGVHARGQVVSMPYPDAYNRHSPHVLQRAMNGLLPKDISVLRTEHITDLDHAGRLFHARHCSRGKIYRYTIWPHRVHDPFREFTAWKPRRPIDKAGWARAQEAAAKLVGTHDFAGFRAAGCQALTTIRHIYRVDVIPPPQEDMPAYVVVEGTAFLKYMVRIMVGTLVGIATGRRPVSQIDEVLANGDRRKAGQTAPPHGLCLEMLKYPEFPWTVQPFDLGESW